MSLTLSHLSESGKLLLKKPSLTETVIELFSTLRFSVHDETRRKCIGKLIVQAILNKMMARFLVPAGKNKIMERFKELLEKRCKDPRDDPCLMYKPAEKLP